MNVLISTYCIVYSLKTVQRTEERREFLLLNWIQYLSFDYTVGFDRPEDRIAGLWLPQLTSV